MHALPLQHGCPLPHGGWQVINWRAAARDGDVAKTSNDPEDQPVGHVEATSTVITGG